LFGRYICKAVKPECENCLFPHVCKTKKSFKPA
jgi:endonuclease III